jgi:hypothetical protein
MPNLLVLKAVAWNEDLKGFYSPSHSDFVWPKGIVARQCDRCEIDHFDPICTCGIYASPNPETLIEYATKMNTVFVLLNTYGWVDVWTGPRDIPHTFIVRAWGAQIIGIVGETATGHPLKLSPQREQAAYIGAERYGVDIYPWLLVQSMIAVTWREHVKFNPFNPMENNDPIEEFNIKYQKGAFYA